MKDFEDTLIDISWRNLDIEHNRFKDIENRAFGIITLIITISGIITTFLARPTNFGVVSKFLFILIYISFLVTILLCLKVISMRSLTKLSTKYLIEGLMDEQPERQIRSTISTIAELEDEFRKFSNIKAKELQYAIYSFGISVILIILYFLWTFLEF